HHPCSNRRKLLWSYDRTKRTSEFGLVGFHALLLPRVQIDILGANDHVVILQRFLVLWLHPVKEALRYHKLRFTLIHRLAPYVSEDWSHPFLRCAPLFDIKACAPVSLYVIAQLSFASQRQSLCS